MDKAKALILAAGYATRLYPLTRDYPKPLLQVKGKPIINYIIDKFTGLKEIDEIFVVTNSKFISHFKRWRKKIRSNKRISLIDDLTKSPEDRLGAVGDIDFTIRAKSIKNDLLVIGGDNLFMESMRGFIDLAKNKNSPVLGVYDIKNKRNATKYGVIKLDKNNKVVDFQEKPRKPKSSLVAMCLYYFPKKRLSFIGEYADNRNKNNDTTGSYIDWLRRKINVYGYIFKEPWYDIGDHKFYDEARKKWYVTRKEKR